MSCFMVLGVFQFSILGLLSTIFSFVKRDELIIGIQQLFYYSQM